MQAPYGMSNEYQHLSDASRNPAVRPETQELLGGRLNFDGPRIQVWYSINPSFEDGQPFEPFDKQIGPTHALLGEVEYRADWQSLYGALQGDFWSPNGEARELILSKGLSHTSMSVGDVLVVQHPDRATETWMCASTGWRQL